MGLEGIVSKRIGSRYVSGRTRAVENEELGFRATVTALVLLVFANTHQAVVLRGFCNVAAGVPNRKSCLVCETSDARCRINHRLLADIDEARAWSIKVKD